MAQKKEQTQRQIDFDAAFSNREAPGYKVKALGIIALFGGLAWSVMSYIDGKGSLQPLQYVIAILGAIICGVGEINELRYTIQQNQMRNEYFAKYGFDEMNSEE